MKYLCIKGDLIMCDTVVAFNNKKSYFGKNSDRHPEEKQYFYISTDPAAEFKSNPFLKKVDKYINNPYKKLKKIFKQFDHEYTAAISKPDWMWGAEMGVNEYGLAIGNEAVFSHEKVLTDGLLGMDILRLALHNCRNAEKAVDFIIKLIQHYNQGGDGGYKQKLKYHNSYLIKDYEEAYILETAGTHWAKKKAGKYVAISNSYTIKDDYDDIDKDSRDIDNFKFYYEDNIKTFFSKGNHRQQFSTDHFKNKDINLTSLMALLRSHDGKKEIVNGMKSICMHPGLFIKTETTASMIVEYFDNQLLIWFTGSPNPCLSLFKPLLINIQEKEGGRANGRAGKFTERDFSWDYCKEWRKTSKKFLNHDEIFFRETASLRNKTEVEIIEMMHKAVEKDNKTEIIETCNDCLEKAETYRIKSMKDLLN